MVKNGKVLGAVVKVSMIAALGGAAAAGVAASPAFAAGTGNTVNNCFGVYFNTAWNQQCGSGGAAAAGLYHSTGDCTSSADRELDVRRSRGDTRVVPGGSCRFQVVNVRTTFQ